jgi:metal-dependent amidase/aminoacylase/carboxypeptidase family protein
MVAHVVVRLQTLISREINPSDTSVLTVGSLQAGQTENIIADSAEIGVDIRSVRPETLVKSFSEYFENDFDASIPTTTISEDFSVLATSQGRPCAFWHWGGIEEGLWDQRLKEGRIDDIPANHTARFAPVIQPTMQTGIHALCVAALAFFDDKLQHKL